VRLLPAVFALAALAGTAAKAQDVAPAASELAAANRKDIRCLAVSFALATSPDAKIKANGNAMIAYYLGRLDGRAPKLDVVKETRDEGRNLSLNDLQTYGQSCGSVLGDRVKAITTAPAPPSRGVGR
jgi:hypothetical protein